MARHIKVGKTVSHEKGEDAVVVRGVSDDVLAIKIGDSEFELTKAAAVMLDDSLGDVLGWNSDDDH